MDILYQNRSMKAMVLVYEVEPKNIKRRHPLENNGIRIIVVSMMDLCITRFVFSCHEDKKLIRNGHFL